MWRHPGTQGRQAGEEAGSGRPEDWPAGPWVLRFQTRSLPAGPPAFRGLTGKRPPGFAPASSLETALWVCLYSRSKTNRGCGEHHFKEYFLWVDCQMVLKGPCGWLRPCRIRGWGRRRGPWQVWLHLGAPQIPAALSPLSNGPREAQVEGLCGPCVVTGSLTWPRTG